MRLYIEQLFNTFYFTYYRLIEFVIYVLRYDSWFFCYRLAIVDCLQFRDIRIRRSWWRRRRMCVKSVYNTLLYSMLVYINVPVNLSTYTWIYLSTTVHSCMQHRAELQFSFRSWIWSRFSFSHYISLPNLTFCGTASTKRKSSNICFYFMIL